MAIDRPGAMARQAKGEHIMMLTLGGYARNDRPQVLTAKRGDWVRCQRGRAQRESEGVGR